MPSAVNVPDVQGVPPVIFASSGGNQVELLTQDTARYITGSFGQQWGLFLNGQLVVTADTVAAFDYKKDWALSDYPVEQGGFESYDKVERPFDVRLRFVAGGSAQRRAALLATVGAISGTTTLYAAATPDVAYANVSVKGYSYSRTAANGLSLLVIDVLCSEVRQASAIDAMSVASPSASPTVNDGTVQALPPTPAQQLADGVTAL